jgi:hypothetical protein
MSPRRARHAPRRRAAGGLAALLASLALAACRGEAREPPCACADPAERPVDRQIVAWLSRARSLHHLADVAEESGKLEAAIEPLAKLVSDVGPWGASPPPEVDEVLADTRARLAELRSQLGAFDAAAGDIEEGLRHAPSPDYWRGHLLEVRGLVEERRAKALAARGDAAGAERAREAATRASLEAIAIQEQVIRREAPDAGADR